MLVKVTFAWLEGSGHCMKPQTNKILLWTGLITLLIGIGLNILMFISQAWPTYLFFILCGIGLIQILIAVGYKNIKTGWQIFWGLLPFLILYGFIEKDSASYDIFLLPEGYRGQIVIEYGVEDGVEKEFEGKWRIYKIPEDGHLKTQFTIKGYSIRLSDSKYFYADKNDNRKELKHYCEHCSDKDTLTVQVIYGSLRTSDNKSFQDFIIDIPNNEYRNKDYTIQYKKLLIDLTTSEKQRPANRRLAKKRVLCFNEALCFVSSSMLADSLVLRNPLFRQAPNRHK